VTDMDDTFDEFHDFAIDADGLIVAIGHSGYPLNSISACRYNSNGTLDDLFSMDGKTTIDMSDTYEYAYGIAIQADGKILIAGSTDSGGQNDFAIIRLQGVCPLISHTQDLEICSGESVTVGSSTYNSAGSYEDIITLPTGCDSLVTTNLNILPNSASTQNVTIGAGESYTIGNSTYTQSGTYQDVLIAANGCDSVVTTNLTITTGIGIIAGESPLKIWPVPFEDIINIDGCELNDVVSITDLQGRIIRTVLINRLPYAIDLSNLTTGSYLLVHENDEGITTRRVFKIN
ncbi:MAG: T9SS type A sorting domain-containing protein, partial [Flavobacteriales bacterium]|nr:T9SS type A sorting domain-containing protein [Flavobacteriales bacterium]